MAKEVVAQIKLYVPAGQANPAPPVGPALGQHGVNIMGFCKAFTNKLKAGKVSFFLPLSPSTKINLLISSLKPRRVPF